MRGKSRALAAWLTGAAMLIGVGALTASSALASGGPHIPATPDVPAGGGPPPPWTITSNGFISLYSAQGQVITGGSTSAGGLGAFAVASTAASSVSYTKATLFAYTPIMGQDPSTWSGEQISLSPNFPNSSAPAPVGTTANPVTTTPDSQATLAQYVAAFPNTNSDPAWQHLYDLRMKVSGQGLPLTTTYWDLVISVNTSNNTWSVDFPDFTQNTTTALAATPPSPQTAPASPITLKATVTPATVAGTVTFWSGTTQIGTAQTVSSGSDVATASVTPTPTTGTTPYTAVYAPAVGSVDIGSAGNLSYVVNGPPAFEPTLVGPQGPGTARVGGQEFCVASFTNNPTVTYAWQSNGATINGATQSTFTPGASLLNQSLTCSVNASNGAGSVSGTSPGVNVALGAPLVPTTNPKISGPHVVGQLEKVTAGVWSPPAATVTYQWFIGTTKVVGATHATWKVTRAALNKKVHCVVTASAPGFANGVFTTPGVKIT
jgi:hypothetical protein